MSPTKIFCDQKFFVHNLSRGIVTCKQFSHKIKESIKGSVLFRLLHFRTFKKF